MYTKPASKIMIIDDNPQNLKLLGNMLSMQGYEVFAFNNGEGGYRAAQINKPDLILLDINMPSKNGYEVCADFKKDKELESIPVIFLSAYDGVEDIVEAFKNGGVDYITKPFKFEEVEIRVKTHLKIIEMQKILENEKLRLEMIVAERTKELNEAYKKIRTFDKMKSELLGRVSNEMASPWRGILKAAEGLFSGDKNKKEIESIYQNKERIEEILNDAELLSKIEFYDEKPEIEKVNILEVIKNIDNIDDKIDFTLSKDKTIGKIAAAVNINLFKKALKIVLEFVEKYSEKMKIVMRIREEHKNIYLSFILQDFFIKHDEIFDFVSHKNDKINQNEGKAALSNILAHKIVKLFDGDLYIEKLEEGVAALTIKLIKE